MKKYFLTLNLMIFLIISVLAQHVAPPPFFNYQAIAKDGSGNILANQTINLRLSILDSIPTVGSNIIFAETQSIITNADGLFNVEVGRVNQSLDTLNWRKGMKFFQLEMDITGGTSFVLVGKTQLISVPYSIHSHSSTMSDSSRFSKTAETALKYNPRINPNIPGGIADSTIFIDFIDSTTNSYTVPTGMILYFPYTNCYKSYSGGIYSDGFNAGALFTANTTIYLNSTRKVVAYLIKDKNYDIVNLSSGTTYTVPSNKYLLMVSGRTGYANGYIIPNGSNFPTVVAPGTMLDNNFSDCNSNSICGSTGYLIDK
jgi:hypothetical protein